MALLRKKYWKDLYKIATEITKKTVFPEDREHLKNLGVADFEKEYYPFPHPETDYEDDSLGISRKFFRKLLETFGKDGLLLITRAVTAFEGKGVLVFEKDEDGFVDWTAIFKNAAALLKSGGDVTEPETFVVSAFRQYLTEDTSPEREIFSFEAGDSEAILFVQKLLVRGIVDAVYNNSEDALNEAYREYEKRKFEILRKRLKDFLIAFGGKQENFEKWEEKEISPSIEELKLLDPDVVVGSNPVFREWGRLFGVKQLAKIPDGEKHLAVVLAAIDPEIRSMIRSKDELRAIWEMGEKAAKKLTKKRLERIREVERKIRNKEVFDILLGLKNSELKFLSNLPVKGISEVVSYKGYSVGTREGASALILHLLLLKKVYDKRASETDIPMVEGEVDGYRYKTLSKDDPWGLFCGYAVDNCQVYGGAGGSCLEAGYENKNAGFIAVWNAKGYMVAEMYVWVMPNGDIVIDSIEALGQNNGGVPGGVVQACAEVVKDIVAENLNDSVYIGTGSGIYHAVIQKIQEDQEYNTMMADLSNEDLESCPSSYTDAARSYKVVLA